MNELHNAENDPWLLIFHLLGPSVNYSLDSSEINRWNYRDIDPIVLFIQKIQMKMLCNGFIPRRKKIRTMCDFWSRTPVR